MSMPVVAKVFVGLLFKSSIGLGENVAKLARPRGIQNAVIIDYMRHPGRKMQTDVTK